VESARPSSAFVFRPEPEAASCRIEDELRVDDDTGFGDAERRPLADELKRPGRRQRPRLPPGDEGVRSAAAGEQVKDRPGRLGIALLPVAAWATGGLPAVGELQAEPEGAPGGGQVTRPAWQVLLGAASAWPDPRGQEDLDPGWRRLTAR
jgi:hypothetical protein